jgi:hypothetical protein
VWLWIFNAQYGVINDFIGKLTFGMVGPNGSAAYADIDSGVAVAVMRNRIVGDFTAVKAIDAVVAAHHG